MSHQPTIVEPLLSAMTWTQWIARFNRNALGGVRVIIVVVNMAVSAAAQTTVSFFSGLPDDFAPGIDAATPDAHLKGLFPKTYGFDEFPPVIAEGSFEVNSALLHRFDALPPQIVSATLEVRILEISGASSISDIIGIWFDDGTAFSGPWSCPGDYVGRTWVNQLGDSKYCITPDTGVATPGLPWTGLGPVTFSLDLSDLPMLTYGGGVSDVIPLMNQHGFIDIEISDETALDYLKLTVTTAALAAPWSDLGFALAGAGGEAVLLGTGSLAPGSSGTLDLIGAATTSRAILFVSLSGVAAPFKCGTLVPVPVDLQLPLFTNGVGVVTLGWRAWPNGLSGRSLHLQYAIQDQGAICGVALSNALRAEVP